MDEALQQIAAAVEAGRDVPPIILVTASQQVTGTPVDAREFSDAYAEALHESSLRVRSRRERHREADLVDQRVAARMPALAKAVAKSSGSGLNFVEPHVTPIGGRDIYEYPVLRVPIAAVVSWSIGLPEIAERAPMEFLVGGGVSFNVDD